MQEEDLTFKEDRSLAKVGLSLAEYKRREWRGSSKTSYYWKDLERHFLLDYNRGGRVD